MSIYDEHELDGFLTVMPRSTTYLTYTVSGVSLRVIRDNDVEVAPDVNLKVNDLSGGTNQILNNSGNRDRFKISIIILDDDIVHGDNSGVVKDDGYSVDPSSIYIAKGVDTEYILFNREAYEIAYDYSRDIPVVELLDYWIKNAIPLYVTTNAIDIPDDYYVIVGNKSRKQKYDNSTVWNLEFLRYKEFVAATYKNDNKVVQAALKKYNNQSSSKSTAANKKVKQGNQLKAKFKKCDRSKLSYTKRKKNIACVKVLQQLLIYYNCLKDVKSNVDGYYGKVTVAAVEKFQKKYKKKYGLSIKGHYIDQKTFKALYTGGTTAVAVKNIDMNSTYYGQNIMTAKLPKTVGEVKQPAQGDISVEPIT